MSVFTDFLRPVSPPPVNSYRRASLNAKSLSLDEDTGSLSTSLPLSTSKDDFNTLEDFKKSKQEAKKGLLHSRSGTFAGSPRSPTQLSPFGVSRPRSASLHSPRKGFLGLPKNRQPSLKKTPKHGASDDSSTSAIDAALVVIKNQLELLSEGNQVIEERVNNLTTEITQILALRENNYPLNYNSSCSIFPESSPARRPCFKRTLSDEPCSRRTSKDNTFGSVVLSDLKETCEELAIEKSYEGQVKCLPFDLTCKKFDESFSSQRRDSLDSTGSSGPISRTSSNDVCVVIITDMSESPEGVHVEPVASQTSGSSQAEDDVFMSQ